MTTTQLLQYTASAMKIKSRLIPVPALITQAIAKLLGKDEIAQRFCSNLQVDISKACKLLGWMPLVSVREGLRRTLEGYVQSGSVLK